MVKTKMHFLFQNELNNETWLYLKLCCRYPNLKTSRTFFSTNLGGRHDRNSRHYTIRIILMHFWHQQGTKAWASTSTKWVSQLEALQTVRTFSLFTNNIQDRIHKFCTLSVVSFGPVVASSSLAYSIRRINKQILLKSLEMRHAFKNTIILVHMSL